MNTSRFIIFDLTLFERIEFDPEPEPETPIADLWALLEGEDDEDVVDSYLMSDTFPANPVTVFGFHADIPPPDPWYEDE